jgi:NAD(P)-dependent dehydrogenase (short-subunit alcohol dehydrogenase family)
MDLGLRGKVAVVTGGAGAICGQCARLLAAEGCDIALVDMAPSGGAVERAIAESGRRTLYVRCDVTQAAEVGAMVRRVLETFGTIDILVNGAGTTTIAQIQDLEEAEWDRVLTINLKGTFLCSRAVIPHMKARRSGTIVHIASGLGHTPTLTGIGHYAAAKGGMIVLGKAMALELAPHKINVNSVAPGAIDAPLGRKDGNPGREQRLSTGARIPLGRVGRPDDVAKVVVFLASSAAAPMTGQTIFINGGALMP